VAIFIDPTLMSRRFHGNVASTYDGFLAASRLGKALVPRNGGTITACDATSRSANIHATIDILKIGDASLTLDPLSSQGIQHALASALQGAIVANTILVRPSMADAAAQFYNDRQLERQQQHQRAAGAQYAHLFGHFDTPFWRVRASARATSDEHSAEHDMVPLDGARLRSTRVAIARNVTIGETSAIEGNFVTLKNGVLRNGSRPLVYVGKIEVAGLIRQTAFGRPVIDLLTDWSRMMDAHDAWSTLTKLVNERVLTLTAVGNSERP
jgi:hypothetical protein